MAYFPFDFAAGERSRVSYFNELIMDTNSRGRNSFGFNFDDEMEDWHLVKVHNVASTGFRVVVYSCPEGRAIVLAFRGTTGSLENAVLHQTGAWWCNFRSLAGYRHSHIGNMVDFISKPATIELLQDAYIYITGHSLGGYLSYVATYELAQLGFEGNIKRVAVFAAPILNDETFTLISALGRVTRRRMVHYYVPEDLIAGAIGVEMEGYPQGGAFEQLTQLFGTLQDARDIDVPPAVYTFSNLMGTVERLVPLGMPEHITELVWKLNGAMGEDAIRRTAHFKRLVRHVAVEQTWHTARPDPIWYRDVSLRYMIRNYTQELAVEIALDMIGRVFDEDTHYMMNFYGVLAGR